MASLWTTYQNRFGKKLLFAVEHATLKDREAIHGITAVSKQGEFDILTCFETSTIAALSEHIGKGSPVSLIVTTDQVLTRKVEGNGVANELVAKAFPNLDLSSFYYEIHTTESTSFVSVCRKAHVDELIASYALEDIFITDFSIGTTWTAAVIPYIHAPLLYNLTTAISVQDGAIETIVPHEERQVTNYTFGEQQISSRHILSLAMALKAVGSSVNSSGNTTTKTLELQTKFKEKKFFKTTLFAGIGFLLIALLINFWVFSAKFANAQKLKEDLQVYTAHRKQLEQRLKMVKKKEAIVKSVLNTGFSKSSLYIDQIIQSQPSTILLEGLTYQPLEKMVRKEKSIHIANKLLSVHGHSVIKEDFTNWINTMETLDFVDGITIADYGNTTTKGANFTIQIHMIKDDATK